MTRSEAEELAERIRQDQAANVRVHSIEEEPYQPGNYYLVCCYENGLPFVVRHEAMWQERRLYGVMRHPLATTPLGTEQARLEIL
ncbi:MAG: hypothetical protein IRZ31_01370 [Thermogemmatispora sp.]|uniref:hypothetical protein n=1 Tax=Thermogemmatispora sp. TaxID=1968838 RepID=UPI00260C6D40|nr:hypothetical protein [Thermogemmatispora sp.]MBX5455522.1 hypothetical protein [Thermogemmatispora sp.]